MKISRRIIRKLIREAIEDFARADFVAGTEIDQTDMPRQIFDNISNWLSNNQKSIKKLIAFRKELDSNPRTMFYGPERTAMLNQYNSLSSGLTSNTVTGGMNTNEIKRFQARYITFLGDQLVQNHPKLRQYIHSQRTNMTRSSNAEKNQLDSLFEVLFESVDEVGVGPVTYTDYTNAKEFLYEFESGKPYFGLRHSGHDPVTYYSEKAQDNIFNQNSTVGPRRDEFDSEDYSMTSNFNSQNTSITDGLGLYVINAYFDLIGYNDGYGLDRIDHDAILENVIDELYIAPGMISGIDIDAKDDYKDSVLRFFIIATDDELADFEASHDQKEIIVDSAGHDGSTEYVTLSIEADQLIQPNSMDSIRQFLDPYGAGVPTYSNSALGIKREHETFLQSALNAAKSLQGSHDFANKNEEERSHSSMGVIYHVLNLKGYNIEGI